MTFIIKKNDTAPSLQRTLTDSDGAIDLTGATVRFHMAATVGGTAKVDAEATIVTAASGIVKYDWASGDTDTTGSYYGEFEITYSDGSSETVPNPGFITINITADLA